MSHCRKYDKKLNYSLNNIKYDDKFVESLIQNPKFDDAQ